MLSSEKVKEIVKCGKEPIYFINKYCKVQHPVQGTISFKTYDYQNEVIQALEDHRFNIVLKSRQLGLSTVSAAYTAWLATFHKDKNIIIIATKLETAQNFLKKVKFILRSMPQWLLLPSYEDNKRQVTFSNGSVVTAIPTSEDAGRSEAVSLLVIDEAAIIKDAEELWAGLYPTLSTGGRAILISTPKGVGNLFHKLWVQAENGQNEFHTIKLPWNVHPERDDGWFYKETKNMSPRQIAQEMLCDFATSGDTFLPVDALERLMMATEPPIAKEDSGGMWVWKRPIPEHKYILTSDVARGDARDFSTMHIVDIDVREIVAEYMGKVPPEILANMIKTRASEYNNAFVCVEKNTFGYFTNMLLKKDEYPHLYYERAEGDVFRYTSRDPAEMPGFTTSAKSKVQILTKLEEVLRTGKLVTKSQRLYDQLKTFVWNNNKAEALKDAFDDLVISAALAAWLLEGASATHVDDQAIVLAMLKATHAEVNTASPVAAPQAMVPFGGQYALRGMMDPRTILTPQNSERYHQAGDLDWLLK